MTNKIDPPKTGDMYRCQKCEFEIHVTKGCDCKTCKTDLQCCDEPLEKVTAPSVQNA